MAVLHRNDAFSFLVLSTKRRYTSFLKKGFRFPQNRFKMKPLRKAFSSVKTLKQKPTQILPYNLLEGATIHFLLSN